MSHATRSTPMTRAEALAEAQRRWGHHGPRGPIAFADWFTLDDDPPTHEFRVGYWSYPGMGTEQTHWMGRGDTPEAAFADADTRSNTMAAMMRRAK